MFGNAQMDRVRVAKVAAGMSNDAKIRLQPGNGPSRQFEAPVWAGARALTCAKCNLRETCLSGGVPDADLEYVENIVYARRLVKRGERLFSAGDQFSCLFAIRNGFFKMSQSDTAGREQITGFFMSGELLGMGGLGSGRFEGDATALEDSLVCAMPYSLIEKIGRDVPSLQRRLHLVLSREIVRGQGLMMLLGSMGARQRAAAFLINLSRRLAGRGYSGSGFLLRMTRAEIASYLGLELETISRVFSHFQREGLIEVRGKQVAIIDNAGLERMLALGG
jgi:CRP/FNR family transcriptional regulator